MSADKSTNIVMPCRFRSGDIGNGFKLDDLENGLELKAHLLRTGASSPSLILAHAARGGAKSVTNTVAQGLTALGLNVFHPRAAVPVIALSVAIARRGMKIGLYLDEDAEGFWTLLPLAAHGGPVENAIQEEVVTKPLRQTGVLGETEIIKPYLQTLEGLLDPNIGEGPRLSTLECPFPEIEQYLREKADSGRCIVLRERNTSGPRARISPDGQGLEIEWPAGKHFATTEMVAAVGQYLHEQRSGRGTIIGPPGTVDLVKPFSDGIEIIEVHDGPLEMSYRAGFADLLMGWWEPGIIAHQGHGPFGDGLLTLAYLLESWSS
ncbi:MAG: hypothetical protein HQM09_11280 [Candidatus Riflebacteria bacterium]|nr:hypothetical protein [Candidatus Riflebacteria bacterium]